MLNWYRALFQTEIPENKVQVPVRIIWGLGDQFLHQSTAKESLKFCADGELILVDDATHWVLHEQPDIVNRLIKEFILNHE